jgi:predicted RNA-binding protein with TRAM domain
MSSQLRLLMSNGQNTRTTKSLLKPVETGKEYTVDITENGSAGDGIARIEGLIIFVKDAKAGYKNVKIRINSVKDRFATAEIAAGSTDTT